MRAAILFAAAQIASAIRPDIWTNVPPAVFGTIFGIFFVMDMVEFYHNLRR